MDWLTDKMRERDHTVSATHGDMDQVRIGFGCSVANAPCENMLRRAPARSCLWFAPAGTRSALAPALRRLPNCDSEICPPQNTRNVIMRELFSGTLLK